MATPEDTARFGLSVALALPVEESGAVAYGRLAAHAASCLDAGCGSVTLFGSTGEGASLGIAERERVLGALAGHGIAPDSQIVGGVVANSVPEAVAQFRQLGDFGCRTVLLLPPFYYPEPDEDGLHAWFSAVLDRGGAAVDRVILYHIPAVTQVPVSADLVGRLRDAFPGLLAGVKDSSGDGDNTARLMSAHGDLAILVGDERQLGPAMRKGAQGSISGLANVCAGALRRMIETGEQEPAVTRLVEAVLAYPVTPAIKALIAHRTGDPAWVRVRPPLSPLDSANVARLGAAYDAEFGARAR